MEVTVKLFPPLKFDDGKQMRKVVLKNGSTIEDLLNSMNEKIFNFYGIDSLLVIINNKVFYNNFILKDGQVIEILLNVTGG